MNGHIEKLEQHFGRPLNEFEQLISQSLFSLGILVNPANDDVQFVYLATATPADVLDGYVRRGLRFAGTVGFSKTLEPRTKLVGELEDRTIKAITDGFKRLTERAFVHAEESFLERLHSLIDPRGLPN